MASVTRRPVLPWLWTVSRKQLLHSLFTISGDSWPRTGNSQLGARLFSAETFREVLSSCRCLVAPSLSLVNFIVLTLRNCHPITFVQEIMLPSC